MSTDQANLVSLAWRRFLRFSVRGLIVLVLVIGAGLGWITRQAHIQRHAVLAITKAQGHAYYDIDPGVEAFPRNRLSAWRRLISEYIGIDFVFHVTSVDLFVTPHNNDAEFQQAITHLEELAKLQQLNLSGKSVTDGDLARVASLKHLEVLMLQNSGISDAGLTHVRDLTNLREIYITNAPIGDEGLNHFRTLPNLRYLTYRVTRLTDAGMERLKELGGLEVLHLGNAQVSDAGVRHLIELSNLRSLSLHGFGVTDAGLAHLKGLTKLSKLDIRGTRVTDAGVRELKQALPSLKITR
jgi:hypothetical protein